MKLEEMLAELRSIKGYKCSGLLDFTGEMLVKDSVDPGIDLDVAAPTFNDTFRGAHEAAGKVGLQATTEMLLQTPNGVILMLCSGIRSDPHIHLICVLEKGGNHALAKIAMSKLVPEFVRELA